VDKTNRNWLPWQRSLRDRKTNFRLITYGRNSTNPENLAKIGPVHFEIIGLAGIESLETNKNKKQKQNTQPAVPAFSNRAS